MDVRRYNEIGIFGVSFTRDKLNDPGKVILDRKYVVALYSGPDFPVECAYYDRLLDKTYQTRLVQGSCTKIELTSANKIHQSFGTRNLYRFSVKLSSFWNNEFKLKNSPAKYSVSVVANCETFYHRVVSVYVGGQKFYSVDRFNRDDVGYMFQFLQTAINEMIYLPNYPFYGKEEAMKNPGEYFSCEFRRKELLFWLSHHNELFPEIVEVKPTPPSETPVERHYTGEHKETKAPVYDRTTMGVSGTPEAQIHVKNVNELADCVLTRKGYIVINFTKTHGHAFWVIRSSDYEHFMTINSRGKKEFDKSLEDADHPIYRFYHHPTAYARLQKFAF